ncbi:MAG: molybdopterin biosynthesis protein [Desulfobulbus propionicus]|nr:MAG: molybdopterin biosynthesis protein [Desulfobulbus propionicus]
MKRKIYLNMQSLEEAQQAFQRCFSSTRTPVEEVPSREAAGRVTAAPVFARLSAPAFHCAAMDGLAVDAQTTFGASDEHPLTLTIDNIQAHPVNTGHPLPGGTNAVIIIENVVMDAGQQGVIRAPVYPWQNVRKVGEDIVATELLFPSGHLVKPADTAALLTAGCATITVFSRPKITIIPTGSELVDLGTSAPAPGKIIESNSSALAGLAEQAGARATVHPIIADDYETLKTHLLNAVHTDADIVVINAGSSAGSADYTVQLIDELGEVITHGVTIMPGKPTILGCIEGKPVVGNPGYPVSAIISFEQFVVPLIARMQGRNPKEPRLFKARLAKDLPSSGGIEEFRRMITGRIGNNLVSVPLKKGAGAITTLTRANSMMRISSTSEGELRGSEVDIELLQPLADIEKTLLCTGSHDLCLDLIHDALRQQNPSFPLASTHVGSLGGIMAVRDRMTHIAGVHLLDPATGTYNVMEIRRYLKDIPVRLVTLVHRQQGLIVPRGNPKNIQGVGDLADNRFINRQGGSGTRVLLDYELARQGLDPDDIPGYENEEYTHMAVAVAVLSGKADAGLGILAAARALELDFIPVTEERYDLLIPEECCALPMVKAMLDVITGNAFQQSVAGLGGYSTRDTGTVVDQDATP